MRNDWYFKGYRTVETPGPDGRGKKTTVYTGEWYGFAAEAERVRRVKWICGVTTVIIVLFYLYAQLSPTVGGRVSWIGATSLIALVPLMFEAMGLGVFIMTRGKWELRNHHSGYQRMRRFAPITLALFAIWFGMELSLVIRYTMLWSEEWKYLLACAVCFAAQTVKMFTLWRNPTVVVEDEQLS